MKRLLTLIVYSLLALAIPAQAQVIGGGTIIIASALIVGSTPTNGGAAGQILFDTGTVLSESGNLIFASNALTIGHQQTVQGSLILANTAAGAYSTTFRSSNSATAASILVFPPALAGSGPVVLTDALGNGVLSWAEASGGSSTITAGSTATSGFTNGQVLTSNGANVVTASSYIPAAATVATMSLVGGL
jgi:hypothetical protein